MRALRSGEAGGGSDAMAKGGIPLGELSGSDATDRLRVVIEQHQKATERQTRIMICLTWVMAFLTLITAALTAVTAMPIIEHWPTVRSWLPW